MRCQFCNCDDSRVVDSRSADDGKAIRRRRECTQCGRRFTTYEKVEMAPLMVVKQDGRREAFNLEKVKNGMRHSCEKLPVSAAEIDAMATRVEQMAYNSNEGEISSQKIGNMVMDELRKTNEVAYVRFAAVYRKFTDVSTFMSEIQKLLEEDHH